MLPDRSSLSLICRDKRPVCRFRPLVLGFALVLLVSNAAGQSAAPEPSSTSVSQQQAATESSASSVAKAAPVAGETQAGGLPRAIWLGAAAALFLFIAGAAGAKDKHNIRKHKVRQ
jgi:hypothetical protein